MNDIKKRIAVVGVSHKKDKYGFKIFRDLVKNGFHVEGINPIDGEIAGKKIYRNLNELVHTPDIVITVVPGRITEEVVEECNRLGIKEIWMQPGSETEQAINKAKEYGISVTHNACFMVEHGLW